MATVGVKALKQLAKWNHQSTLESREEI